MLRGIAFECRLLLDNMLYVRPLVSLVTEAMRFMWRFAFLFSMRGQKHVLDMPPQCAALFFPYLK